MLNRVKLVLMSLLIFSNISYAVCELSDGLELLGVKKKELRDVSLEPESGDCQNRNHSNMTRDLERGLSPSSRSDFSPSSGPIMTTLYSSKLQKTTIVECILFVDRV